MIQLFSLGCSINDIKSTIETWMSPKNGTMKFNLIGFPSITTNYLYSIPPVKNINTLVYDYKSNSITATENTTLLQGGYELRDIGFDNSMALEKFQGVIILTGQQGSGKSTIAKLYEDIGYHIIDEDTAGSIRKGRVHKTKEFQKLLSQVAQNLLPGIIIDSTNPNDDHRLIYSRLATAAGVKSIIGWVTRPGFYWNGLRQIPIPLIALNVYGSKFTPPSNGSYVRLN